MKDKKKNPGTLSTTILVVLIALVSISLATYAWFSIADNTKLNSMNMDITTGKSLRFDLDPHAKFDDYVSTLSFADITERILRDTGIDISENALEPVTTNDGIVFTYEDGTISDNSEGEVIEFTLNFMATEDMHVHLSSANSKGKNDGTLISSENNGTPKAMRIGFFMDGKNMIYDPNLGDFKLNYDKMTIFGLLSAEQMQYNSNNSLFSIKAGENKPVVVRIWLEGTDDACNNDIKESGYSISLRFVGTDNNYNEF